MHPRLVSFGKFVDNLGASGLCGTLEKAYLPSTDEILIRFVGFDRESKVVLKYWRYPESALMTHGPYDPLLYKIQQWDEKLNNWMEKNRK